MSRPRGFTLVELLVALGLFTVIAGAIAAVSATGLRCWTQAQEALTTLPRLTTCLEHLATQLRSSVTLPDTPWTSGAGTLTFVTTEDQGLTPIIVTYQRTPDGHLVERHTPLANHTRQDHQWFPHVSVLTVHYGYFTEDGTLAWEPTWADPDHVPKLVQITLGPLTKTVLIPTGVFGTYERGGRG